MGKLSFRVAKSSGLVGNRSDPEFKPVFKAM